MSGSSTPDVRPELRTPRNPISRRQVDTVLGRAVAVFAFAFAILVTSSSLMEQWNETRPVWREIVIAALVGSMVLAVVASLVRRHTRRAAGLVAIVYLVVLVSWPFEVVAPIGPVGNHWTYYLITTATAYAAFAFPTWAAAAYLVVVPVAYFFIRIGVPGGDAPAVRVALDAVYCIILGAFLVVIIGTLRRAASNVDSTQATALGRYARAVGLHATEVERVRVDAIVHDSVLTTFISAARAETPAARELAATMASNAIGHLRRADAGWTGDRLTSPTDVGLRIDAAARELRGIEVRWSVVGDRPVPDAVAETLVSAAQQAMVNSLQHAGDGVERWVALTENEADGISIEIGDRGAGFDPSQRSARLGVRVSILERVTGAGGSATIESAPGEGTVVRLCWPATAHLPAEPASGTRGETVEAVS
jgi:signal transduction histidine kinase